MTSTLLSQMHLFRLPLLLSSPVLVMFLSSNAVNAGNLLFNILFSRWMGPAMFGELATLLTLKLALLGVLGAVQFAVSHQMAAVEGSEREASFVASLGRLNSAAFVGLWMSLPVVLYFVWASGLTETLGFSQPTLLFLLLLSLPFAASLSVLRGVALGRLATRDVVISANSEMLVRLIAASAAWYLGLGLLGVVAAIAISIVAAWFPLTHLLPRVYSATSSPRVGPSLAVAAVPFAFLQLGQVILLDGDVVLARTMLDPEQSGYVAALSLFQRVQFFACFGLAGVLLPAVTRAVARGEPLQASTFSVFGLFAMVSSIVVSGAFLFPEHLVQSLVGTAFLPAAEFLLPASLSAIFFTLSYLIATLLHAIGSTRGIWLVALSCPAQVATMSAYASDVETLILAKLACQTGLLAALAVCTWLQLRTNAPRTVQPLT